MKSVIQIILVVIVVSLPFSCENMESIFVDCDHCYTEKPTEAIVDIDFTLDNENAIVPMTLYEGTIESGTIIYEGNNLSSINLEIGKYYSLLVQYKRDGRIINVVDGKKLRLRRDESSCESPCYIILGDNLNVKLK